MSAEQIGGITETRNDQGRRYERRMLVPETELAAELPELGSRAEWAETIAWVRDVQKTWVAPGVWIVRVTAEETDEASILLKSGPDNLMNLVEKSFSLTEISFNPEWFGIRVAGYADCSWEIGFSEVSPEHVVRFYNIYGQWANIGDYIHRNATPGISIGGRTLQSPTKGSVLLKNGPFEGNVTIADENLLGQTRMTRIYECRFNTRRSSHSLSGFNGVSGRFPSDCSPGGDTDGRWLAIYQKITPKRDARGREYLHVVRRMKETPTGNLKWRKDVNGGEWKW